MRYSDEYLAIKKIAVIEEIGETISRNKDCWGADLSDVVNIQASAIIDKIGKIMVSGKTDSETVMEIRKIFEEHKIFG